MYRWLATLLGNLSVNRKLSLGFGLVLVLTLLIAATGWNGLVSVIDRGDKLVLWIMMAAFVMRIVAPQFFPAAYLRWLEISAAGWLAGFSLLAWRYIPYLMQARLDGKEH